MRKLTMMFIFTIIVNLTNCNNLNKLSEDLGDLNKLRNSFIETFPDKDINVNLNNKRYLTITFFNSKFNNYASFYQETASKTYVRHVESNYKNIDQIYYIRINFVESSQFIIFTFSNTKASYEFYKTNNGWILSK